MKLLMVLLSTIFFFGCSPKAVDDLRDPELILGCVVLEGVLAFDSYFDTTKGQVEVCKVKCSKELPENFHYEYENVRTGCHVKVGNSDNEVKSLSDVKTLSDIKRLSDIGE